MSASQHTRRMERSATPDDAGARLDQFWAQELAAEGVSRERVKDWIVGGFAKIGGKACRRPGFRLAGHEELALLTPPPAAESCPEPEDGPLNIVFRDADVVVLDKQDDLATHPAPGKPDGTLVNRLLHHFPELAPAASGMAGDRPGIVHRLDKDTTGLIVVALNEAARLGLARAFAARSVAKTYLAVVHGRPQSDQGDADTGDIDLPMGRHPTNRTKMAVLQKGGREARTGWRRLWTDRLGRASLLAVRLHTGRTHQIRVHLAHLGHPLVGDPVYGPARHAGWLAQSGPLAGLAPRQMLHAFRLGFRHPRTGEALDLRRDPPEDFQALLRALAADCQRVVITGLPGCGKSALLHALAALPEAPPTFSADACVAAFYAPGGDGAALVARAFGHGLLDDAGAVDRGRLMALLLAKPAARRELEDLVHPLVAHALDAFWAANAARHLAVAEVPLYLEAGWRSGEDKSADVLVGLRCPEALRRGVLRESRGIPPETLDAFDSWQWPEERKLAACDLVLNNDAGLDALAAQARTLMASLAALRQARARRFETQLSALMDAVVAEPLELPPAELKDAWLDWDEDEA